MYWREASVQAPDLGSATKSLLREMAEYLVETPATAVAALWMICLPLMYFALFEDLGKSVGVLAEMTVTFLMFLMVFLTVVVSACLIASYCAHRFLKSRWHKVDSVR